MIIDVEAINLVKISRKKNWTWSRLIEKEKHIGPTLLHVISFSFCISDLSDAVCDGIAEFELCKRCVVITTALECITQPGCLFLEDLGACTFEI